MIGPATRGARELRAVAAGFVLLTATRAARGDLLPNELPGASPLTVTVRGALGNRYRPGRPLLLKITIQNDGDAFVADVRVRERRSDGEAVFRGPAEAALAKGANNLEMLAAPAGGAAGTVLEVLRLPPEREESESEPEGEPVFRGNLAAILRPIGTGRLHVLSVGRVSFPSIENCVQTDVLPRELPSSPEGYGCADVVVLERVGREAVSFRQAKALAAFVAGGGRAVFASFRALAPFEKEFFGTDGTPRSEAEFAERVPGYRPVMGDLVYWFWSGLGGVLVFGVEPGEAHKWLRPGDAGEMWLRSFLSNPRGRGTYPWIDASAFNELAPARPFTTAADRAKTVALVGALAACVAVAIFIRKRKAVAGAIVGGAAVLWAIVAALTFAAPLGAAHVVRVRAFASDGRTEIVTDTAVVAAFGEGARVGAEASTGPVFPVAGREGELLSVPYELARLGDRWRVSGLLARGDWPTVVRSRLARGLDEEAVSLRTRTLARGGRARVEVLPGGGVRLEFEGKEPADDVRYLIERFAPPPAQPSGNLAWLWVEGSPEGLRLVPEGRIDAAPGSGTLLIAAAPAD